MSERTNAQEEETVQSLLKWVDRPKQKHRRIISVFWLKSLCLKPTIKVIDENRTKAKVKEPRLAFWKIYVPYFISWNWYVD